MISIQVKYQTPVNLDKTNWRGKKDRADPEDWITCENNTDPLGFISRC